MRFSALRLCVLCAKDSFYSTLFEFLQAAQIGGLRLARIDLRPGEAHG